MTELPKDKTDSVFYFTNISLEELETQVKRMFPNEECPECSLHLDLLIAVTFRLVYHGWSKDELTKYMTAMIEANLELLAEIDEESSGDESKIIVPSSSVIH